MKVYTVFMATSTGKKSGDLEIEGLGVYHDVDRAVAKLMSTLAELLTSPEDAEDIVMQGMEGEEDEQYFRYEDSGLVLELNTYTVR